MRENIKQNKHYKDPSPRVIDIIPSIAAKNKAAKTNVTINSFAQSSYRQKQKSLEKNQFIMQKDTCQIHDKTCKVLDGVPDDKLMFLEEYDPMLRQCPKCMLKTFLRMGADDPGSYNTYYEFMERTGLTVNALKKMYITKKCRTHITRHVLTVYHGDDTWQIVSLDKNGYVQLRHNNYRRLADGTRIITGGYHVQGEMYSRTRFGIALGVICNYRYFDHHAETPVDSCEEIDRANQGQTSTEIAIHDKPDKLPVTWTRIAKWIRSLIFGRME